MMAEWETRDMIINEAGIGTVFVLRGHDIGEAPPLPALLIYKSSPIDEPTTINMKYPRQHVKITLYHDGSLKNFAVSLDSRLTYMVRC